MELVVLLDFALRLQLLQQRQGLFELAGQALAVEA